MTAHNGDPGVPPAAATDSLARLQVEAATARKDEADREGIVFEHEASGRTWRVHVAPPVAYGALRAEGFAGAPGRADAEHWVADNRPRLAQVAERKVSAGATDGGNVRIDEGDLA